MLEPTSSNRQTGSIVKPSLRNAEAVEPTDTNSLPSPPGLTKWLKTADPRQAIFEQEIPINRAWWDRELAEYGFPSDTLVSERPSRAAVFDLADAALKSAHGAERLLWNAIAWGAGKKPRLIRKRIVSVAEDRPRLSELVRQAAVLSADPTQLRHT